MKSTMVWFLVAHILCFQRLEKTSVIGYLLHPFPNQLKRLNELKSSLRSKSPEDPRILYHYVLPRAPTQSTPFLTTSTGSSHHQNRQFHEAPIIILHGLLGSSRNFQSWSRLLHQQLQGKHDIVCIDLRNHGRSSLHGALPMSYEVMARDVIATLHYLHIPRCHIIGHSMGGKVGAMMSLLSDQYHGQLLSLAMLDISPIEYSEQDFESVIECVQHLTHITDNHLHPSKHPKPGSSLTKREIAKIIDSYFPEKSLSMFIQSNLVQDSSSKTSWSFQLSGIRQSLSELLLFRTVSQSLVPTASPSLRHDSYRQRMRELLPVFILKGSNSKFVKSSHLPEISSLFPKYSIGSIRDASHWLHFEKPEETSQQIVHYLSQVKQYYENHEVSSELQQLEEEKISFDSFEAPLLSPLSPFLLNTPLVNNTPSIKQNSF